MRKLKPKILVPQHTRPIEGQEEIAEILTAYRDAIQLVHDQTVRYMNKGLYPDEITKKVSLPPYLADYKDGFHEDFECSVFGPRCCPSDHFVTPCSILTSPRMALCRRNPSSIRQILQCR